MGIGAGRKIADLKVALGYGPSLKECVCESLWLAD